MTDHEPDLEDKIDHGKRVSAALAASAVAAVTILCQAPSAWAIAYGTLSAYDDDKRLVATDNGAVTYDESNGDRMKVAYNTDDRQDNRHASVTKVRWYFNGTFCYPGVVGGGQVGVGCSTGWYPSGSAEGVRTTTFKSGTLWKQLSSTASSARADIEVCEDQGTLNPDECSPRAIRGFSYDG